LLAALSGIVILSAAKDFSSPFVAAATAARARIRGANA
jgi:hypothetical protein